jgi:hypothetical protein
MVLLTSGVIRGITRVATDDDTGFPTPDFYIPLGFLSLSENLYIHYQASYGTCMCGNTLSCFSPIRTPCTSRSIQSYRHYVYLALHDGVTCGYNKAMTQRTVSRSYEPLIKALCMIDMSTT